MVTTITKTINSMGYNNWWCPCGIEPSDCVAAYAAKGAASYADSKINLANPGTYDAVEGVTPDWDAVNGWKFNGTSHYLDTQIPNTILPDTCTMIVKFSNYTSIVNLDMICGITTSDGIFEIGASDIGADLYGMCQFDGIVPRTPTQSGTRGIAGHTAYLNGSVDQVGLGTCGWYDYSSEKIFIGCTNWYGEADLFSNIYVQALVIHNKVLNQLQVQSIGASMP